MGLGKSLTSIALIHTYIASPILSRLRSLQTPPPQSSSPRVLVVAPKNVVNNWEAEFLKWDSGRMITVHNSTDLTVAQRPGCIARWHSTGGVLLLSKDTLSVCQKSSLPKKDKKTSSLEQPHPSHVTAFSQLCTPDLIICDEAHQYIRNKSSQIYAALTKVHPQAMRVALTGTPIQNNLAEYFYMLDWLRPDCLGTYEHFEQE